MKKILLILLLTTSIYSQYGVDPFDWFSKRTTVPLPTFAIDTTKTPPTPYTASWLYFAGSPATRGQFARCLGSSSAQYGLSLASATTDSFEVNFTAYVNGTADITVLGKANWVVITNGGYLKYAHAGGSGYVIFDTLSVDSLTKAFQWHSYRIKYTKANTTLQIYKDGIRVVNNSSYVYNCAVTDYSFSIGNWYAINSISDTNQVNGDGYLKGGISAFNLIRYSSNRDTTYTGVFTGSGQEVYIEVTSNGSHVKGWYEYDRADYTDALPQSLHMELGISPAPDTKDPVWVNTGTTPTYIRTLSGGVAYFYSGGSNNLMTERYTNGETVWRKGDSTWIVVTGRINQINWTSTRAYGDSAVGLAKYNINTAKWTAFKNSQYPTGSLYSACQLDSSIVVGGDLTGFQGVSLTGGIAKFDGTNWTSIDSGFTGVVVRVRNLGGDLYAGGNMTTTGSLTVNGLAKITAGGEWSKFGSGFDAVVYDMIIFQNTLYVGGSFTTANGVTCNGFAKWNGSTFVPIGTGLKSGAGTGLIYCFAIYKNELYAGGTFDSAGGVACSNLFKYNGTTVTAVGTSITRGTGADASIIDMVVDSTYNQLYIKGQFSRFNGRTISCGVVYDGTNFSALPPDDKRPEGILITGNGTSSIRYFFMGDQESVYGVNVGCVYELIPR